MVLKERPLRRRRGRRFVFGRAGIVAPLAHDFARTLLPPHWRARLDADVLAEIREEARWLELVGGYCPGNRIIW